MREPDARKGHNCWDWGNLRTTPRLGTFLDLLNVMKVAIPEWQGRVSPVFDVSTHLLVADVEDARVVDQNAVRLDSEGLHARVAEVTRVGVEVLICGAISWPLEVTLLGSGIDVIPHTCGEVQQVLASFAANRLDQNAFLMPGCCGRRRRFRGQRGRGRPL